ncbi:MAG: DUF1592 domain-containing protein [Fuerstiella sp.]
MNVTITFQKLLLVFLVAARLVTFSSHAAAAQESPAAGGKSHFEVSVAPFLAQHCVACHSGDEAEAGIAFDRYSTSANVQTEYDLWEKAVRLIRDRQMPPPEEPQPTADELVAVATAIQAELATFDCTAEQHPGRVTLRRLNKAEYNNTIRDLIGLDLKLADDFPSDDVGNGFDNIGDVLSLPPVLLEKYLTAAQSIAEQAFADPQARDRVLVHPVPAGDGRIDAVRRNVRDFTERAFRRSITEDEEARLFAIMKFAYEQDSSMDEIFKTVIAAVLSNPHFLFRVERDADSDDEDGIRELNSFEVASRLSYFLWSSMPDKALFDLARSGKLTRPEVIVAQAKRMLADPKSKALVDNFAGQWLQLRDVSRLMPDPELFPDFDGELRTAMRRETELFFESMMKENRSVLEFLNADFTFVNERLARHYGIPGVKGPEFQQVALNAGRRGILTHAGILMLTSNPTRTSPVKRGKWILENILAEPPPPPPANVPELEEDGETFGSLREQMEQHRSNPTCSVCHLKMDAIGFGLEHFDAIGAWRDRDGRFDIDASGELPGGQKFSGAEELMEILVQEKKTEFCRCLAGKVLTYALGRGLSSYDRCTVNDIVRNLEQNDYRFEALITAIVTSDPFTMRDSK